MRRIERAFSLAFEALWVLQEFLNDAKEDEDDDLTGGRVAWATHYLTHAKLHFKERRRKTCEKP